MLATFLLYPVGAPCSRALFRISSFSGLPPLFFLNFMLDALLRLNGRLPHVFYYTLYVVVSFGETRSPVGVVPFLARSAPARFISLLLILLLLFIVCPPSRFTPRDPL